MPKAELLFELTPQTPLIGTEFFTVQLSTYGGYTYAEDYAFEDQRNENKITIMGDSNYDKSELIEKQYWTHAYIEIKVPAFFLKKKDLKLIFTLQAEETTNSVQIFMNDKLLIQEELKARSKQEVAIEIKNPPSSFKLLLRPVFPYPRPFSFFGVKAFSE